MDVNKQRTKLQEKKINFFANAKKVSKAHVPPVLTDKVCDSTTDKETCVRHSIAISAVRIVEVTRLVCIRYPIYSFTLILYFNMPTCCTDVYEF